MFKFLKALFSSESEYIPNPQATPAQKFALATGAVLGEINGNQHEWLYGEPNPTREAIQAVLANGWGVQSRDDLFGRLQWIETEGHRVDYQRIRSLFERKGPFRQDASELLHGEPWAQNMGGEEMVQFRNRANGMLAYWHRHPSLMGWDFCRGVWLCRWGAAAGLLSDEEAWQRIFAYAQTLQQSFSGWSELGENYLAGYSFWSDDDDDDNVRDALTTLTDPNNRNSPWNLVPWATPLA
jgi:hypothetical protein